MELAYQITRVCDCLQTKGKDEDNIVGGTIQNQGPEKRHRTDLNPTPVCFDDDHSQKDRLVEVNMIETERMQ